LPRGTNDGRTDTDRDIHAIHTTERNTTPSATTPGTWKLRFLSRLACSSPTTGTPGAEQYSATSTPLLDVRLTAGTRINSVSLVA
jgi:hypothetical protein